MMSREAVLENVRRFRAIASLYRQTAAFRPGQSWSLLGQAKDWEYRALAELEPTLRGPHSEPSRNWRSGSPPECCSADGLHGKKLTFAYCGLFCLPNGGSACEVRGC